MFVLIPIIALIIGRWVLGKERFCSYTWGTGKALLFLCVLISAFVVLTVSKGNFMAVMMLSMAFFSIVLFKCFVTFRLKVSEATYVVFIILSVSLLFALTPFADLLIVSFTDADAGNTIRSEQSAYIVQEFTVFGSGLGGILESGYTRSGESSAYGFELSYHSLIHKIGVIALIPFLIYIYTVILALYLIFKSTDAFYPVLALGAMGYLIPSYGNPMLFSPIAVVMHCLALFWLRKEYLDVK